MNLLKSKRIELNVIYFSCIYVMFINLVAINCSTEIDETLATTHRNCNTDDDDKCVEWSDKIREIIEWIDTGLLLVVLIIISCLLCCFCSIMHTRRSQSN